ncbi:glucose-1-phosphate adenylyltransferase [Sporichthya sp.]|uniref:glucose-1-phosphate adenylyltransferase n=1 Tax=Sporichthya sp. TaxID=65475 RepID=UPI0017AC9012|nr:glucose-1-phosphate adenylyltransferase [Sporichthya sp.]MBA3741561.1 glucose-1-phosphate adenylyltransferase [Sporichthya sp.]
MASPRVLAIVLAGGEGKRLMPLTGDRAKPAVPFGGIYRLVDFVLSNLVNGGYLKIVVLTQYKNHSLDRHISRTWRMSAMLGNYVTPVPAQQRRGPHWFAGSADAIFQNLNLIDDEQPEHVIVFGADHIYRMDPRQMVAQHIASGQGVTVAAVRQPRSLADQFGVIRTDAAGERITEFLEKPTEIAGLPDSPEEIFASMGNYVFKTSTLVRAVTEDAMDPTSRHDLGGNIIPRLVSQGQADVYDFSRNEVPGPAGREFGYWRDVGTLDAFYEAHMDLISANPAFNLYNREWPIYTLQDPWPPARFVGGTEGVTGHAVESMISGGVQIAGAVERSVLSPGVSVGRNARIEGCVLLDGVKIGQDALVRNAILDKNSVVPDGFQLGVNDKDVDLKRVTITEEGIRVVAKGTSLEFG